MTAAPGNCLISCHNSHIKQNPYSPTKLDPPAFNGRLASALICSFFFFFLLLLPHFSHCLSQMSSSLCCLVFPHSRLHTFPRWLPLPLLLLRLPLLPCSYSLTFFPLSSSLQRGEKHTCQIQVGHHTVSHPHQLLSTSRFDANKFFSILFLLLLLVAVVVVWYTIRAEQSKLLSGTRWYRQQLFTVRVHVTERLRCLDSAVQTLFFPTPFTEV